MNKLAKLRIWVSQVHFAKIHWRDSNKKRKKIAMTLLITRQQSKSAKTAQWSFSSLSMPMPNWTRVSPLLCPHSWTTWNWILHLGKAGCCNKCCPCQGILIDLKKCFVLNVFRSCYISMVLQILEKVYRGHPKVINFPNTCMLVEGFRLPRTQVWI